MRRARSARPKVIAYRLIPPDSERGQPMYQLLAELVAAHHPELERHGARIALAWSLAWKPDVDGRLTLGKCKRATDLDRELAPFDFVVLLNRGFWEDPRTPAIQRKALLDHELMHASVAYDERGEVKLDERGRPVFRTRKHDLEEFSAIVERYGTWKRDIEAFARALARADASTARWIGYSAVREVLLTIGVDVALEVIRTWREADRRAVVQWAQLRQEADVRAVSVDLSETMPACLAEALRATSPAA